MIPWVHLDSAAVPGGSGTLKLMQRGDEFSITSDNRTLMNSRTSSSEVALAALVCARLQDRRGCNVLVGGYGMGYTLRAALAELNADARILVVELVPAVVAWARGPMAELTDTCLSDPRVTIREGDIGDVLASERASFDAIVLDVDNGPNGLSRSMNNRLYDMQGLVTTHTALRPKGMLAVWSAAPDPDFSIRLGRAGFLVEETKIRANKGRGSRHTIWMATKAETHPRASS
jgi:spermidine synthase